MDTPPEDGSGSQSKTPRRQFAYYPNVKSSNKPQKPFSRSAAKRESVMALGSIEYLQHYFTKSGIAAESDPTRKPRGAVPAIGSLDSLKERPNPPQFILPPSPAIPQAAPPTFPPFVKTYDTDPENLRPVVIDDLISVAAGWKLNPGAESADAPHDPNFLGVGEKGKPHVEILDLLKATTRAVRSVRNFLVSLPDDSHIPQPRAQFRPATLSSSPLPRRVSLPNTADDPLTQVRGRALEVLSVLRELEESSRLPLDHDAYDAQSDHGSSNETTATGPISRGTSPTFLVEEPEYVDADTSVSISFVHVAGQQRSVPVWEDDSNDVTQLSDEEHDKRDRWDERLVLGGGWLYRQDIQMDELAREREVVAQYLNAVDRVLFGGPRDGKRGWEREKERMARKALSDRSKSRRVSSGSEGSSPDPKSARSGRRVVSTSMLDSMRNMVVTEEPEDMESIAEEDVVDDDDLPNWAKRSTFVDDQYGRLHALLIALIPPVLLPLLPLSSSEHEDTLRALSSGQILCVAYNAGVRRSRKPWGYVLKDAIHDIAALELAQSTEGDAEKEKSKRGWTFRRTDNLRLWAAALKLRYSLPVVLPAVKRGKELDTPVDGNTPLPSPSGSTVHFPITAGEDSIIFDAQLVARTEPGWELMLERLVLKWVDVVVAERRGER